MKIEEIIENLNRMILSERAECENNNKSFLMIHKTIIPHKVMKVLKEISIVLWFVDPDNKVKEKVLTIHRCYRVITGQENKIIEEVSKEMLCKIFQFVRTKDFNDIIDGKYRNKSKEIIA